LIGLKTNYYSFRTTKHFLENYALQN